jgi:orotate phosphoribosyltransferase
MGGGDVIPEAERDTLRELLRTRSVRRGDFVLASGARSSYYIDARLTTMSGAGQLLVGSLGLATLDARGWEPSAVGGLTLGADPIACALAHAAARAHRSLDAFTVRKQAKGHGTGRRIEGNLVEGASVVVVEDVITSGGSALDASAAVEEAGARVLGVFGLVLREEDGLRRIQEAGYPVAILFTARELLRD